MNLVGYNSDILRCEETLKNCPFQNDIDEMINYLDVIDNASLIPNPHSNTLENASEILTEVTKDEIMNCDIEIASNLKMLEESPTNTDSNTSSVIFYDSDDDIFPKKLSMVKKLEFESESSLEDEE